MLILVIIEENVDFSQNFPKNFQFDQNFRKFRILKKKIRKILILVNIYENLDFDKKKKIYENLDFGQNCPKITNLIKIVEKSRFWTIFFKILDFG